jgi:hypothetical protein
MPRGKQKIDPTVRDFHMRRISDARARLWNAKAEFEERKRQEWAALKAQLEQDTHRAVWEARDAKLIIDDIKHAYGVSNASVIYGVLRERPTDAPATQLPSTATYTYDAATRQLTNHALSSTVEVDAARHRVTRNDSANAAWWLDNVHTNPTHEAWEATR